MTRDQERRLQIAAVMLMRAHSKWVTHAQQRRAEKLAARAAIILVGEAACLNGESARTETRAALAEVASKCCQLACGGKFERKKIEALRTDIFACIIYERVNRPGKNDA